MKSKIVSQRGQALILIALAAIGFFGIVGLAIDGSAKFSDRRHAQNAADTAALAGAWTKANSKRHADDSATTWAKVRNAARDRAAENGYDGDLVRSVVEVYNPPAYGIYSNCYDVHFTCTDYVQVVITSYVDTWFAGIVGIEQTTNHVEAVASIISEDNHFNFGGNAIVALSPEGCALVAGGTTDVTVQGGGLYSNSDESCAFKKTACAGNVAVLDENGNQGTITTVGGYQTNTNCSGSINAGFSVGAKQLSFPPPYQEIPEPAECSTAGTATFSGNTATLTPGSYSKIPGNGNQWNGSDTIILQPGVYCLTGTGATLNPNNNQTLIVPGTFGANPADAGVFIYLRPGGYFTFNAQTTILIWGMNDANVALNSTHEIYKGFLLYVAPNYASGSPVNCTINGGTDDGFMGSIYAPYCNLKINGNSTSTGFQSQLIGYTVDLTGTSGITLTYDGDNAPEWNIPLQVGLNK